MADLTHLEKRKLEKLLGMVTGYVLDFKDRTFQEFFLDVVGKDIYDKAYEYASGSKANRLRKFWSVEPNFIVGRVLREMLHVASEQSDPNDQEFGGLWMECERIVVRLEESAAVPEIEAINPNTVERDFKMLARAVREAIEKNQPESGLDRLHTFVTRYLRVLCEQRHIQIQQDKPLHSLMGEYVRALKQQGQISSEMTERILKSSISILDAFNAVRNNQSFAHPSPILNYNESLLIFNHMTALVRFIESIERPPPSEQRSADSDDFDHDIPF